MLTRPQKIAALQAAALSLLVLGVYSNVYDNAFQLDDHYRVVDNPGIQTVWPPWRHFTDPTTMSTLPRIVQYRPLLPLSLSISHALTGDSPRSFHYGNVALHLLAVLMGWLFLRELVVHRRVPGGEGVAWLAAAIFAVHPVSGIAVNYVSARDLSIMLALLFASLTAYARMRRKGETPRRWAAVMSLLGLSLLAKKNGVVAPALVLVMELLVLGGGVRSKDTWRRVALMAAAVGGTLATIRFGVGFSDAGNVIPDGLGPMEYARTQLQVHVQHYLATLIWPTSVRQAAGVTANGTLAAVGALVIAGSLVVAWRVRRRSPLISLGILFWWGFLALTSSVIPTHHDAVHYRPYASTLFAALLFALAVPSRARPAVGVMVVGLLSVASWRHSETWKTEESLWSHSVAHGGDALAHHNLGVALMGRDPDRAATLFQAALKEKPNYILAHINLGLVRIAQDRPEDGRRLLKRAVALEPGRAQSHHWEAVGLSRIGDSSAALVAAERSVRLDPENAAYRMLAGQLAQKEGDFPRSAQHLSVVARRAPLASALGFSYGFALQKSGKNEAAVAEYRRFLKREPDHVQVRFNVGFALMTLGRCAEARAEFRRVLELRPSYAEAQRWLDHCR